MSLVRRHPSRPLAFPHEIVGRIVHFATLATPGQAFGGLAPGAEWTSSEAAASLALVGRGWYWEAQRALYRAPVLTTADTARAFGATLDARPVFATFPRDVVIGLSSDEDDEDPLATSRAMVRAVARCTLVSRVHLLPLHRAVREELFAALSDKPLAVAVWAPSPPASLFLQWGEALLEPTDAFAHPNLWYLEVHSRTRLHVAGTVGLQLRPSLVPSHISSCPSVTPRLTHLRLHFDLDATALLRLLTRCPNLQALDICPCPASSYPLENIRADFSPPQTSSADTSRPTSPRSPSRSAKSATRSERAPGSRTQRSKTCSSPPRRCLTAAFSHY